MKATRRMYGSILCGNPRCGDDGVAAAEFILYTTLHITLATTAIEMLDLNLC
jgi:hypothetical protein